MCLRYYDGVLIENTLLVNVSEGNDFVSKACCKLQVDRGAAVRALQEGVEAAEARRASLQQELVALQQRAQNAEAAADAAQQLQRATQQVCARG